MQLHDALQEEKEDIRAELIAEVGSTVGMTYIAQMEWPLADAIRYPAELISTFQWERMLDQDAKMGVPYNRVVVKEPMGVVGAITPWNFPFEIISNKVGQILATGNTMVLKPAIETPWSALRWGRIIAEKTDIPAGVVNIVPASDNDIAQVLATDPRIDMVSFTGSTAVGQLIQRLSADTMKRNMLELGGKSAYLVLDDADMNMALPGCIGALMHSGQGCALATRMLVPRSHYDQAVEVATATFGALTVGDPSDPNTFCGPLVSAKQRARVLNYIEIAKRDGGRVTVGGGVPDGLDRGYFVAPTVVADVAPDHTIFQEEVFGPVLSITPYDGGDDGAVEMANNSTYGLAGAIMGSDERAMAVAPSDPNRLVDDQQRHVLRRRRSVRWIQDERHRPAERHRGLRAAPADQDDRLSRCDRHSRAGSASSSWRRGRSCPPPAPCSPTGAPTSSRSSTPKPVTRSAA